MENNKRKKCTINIADSENDILVEFDAKQQKSVGYMVERGSDGRIGD